MENNNKKPMKPKKKKPFKKSYPSINTGIVKYLNARKIREKDLFGNIAKKYESDLVETKEYKHYEIKDDSFKGRLYLNSEILRIKVVEEKDSENDTTVITTTTYFVRDEKELKELIKYLEK